VEISREISPIKRIKKSLLFFGVFIGLIIFINSRSLTYVPCCIMIFVVLIFFIYDLLRANSYLERIIINENGITLFIVGFNKKVKEIHIPLEKCRLELKKTSSYSASWNMIIFNKMYTPVYKLVDWSMSDKLLIIEEYKKQKGMQGTDKLTRMNDVL